MIERDGAVLSDEGLPIEFLKRHINATGGVKGFPGATHVEDGASVLEHDCDILIPAAMEAVINLGNADRIRAPLIIEAANGPITAGADDILRRKGIVIIPDLYANAGGVTVSYFEWVKTSATSASAACSAARRRRSTRCSSTSSTGSCSENGGAGPAERFRREYVHGAGELELVRSGLDDTMRTAYQSMREVWHGRKEVEDLRVAAYLVSIGRVAASYRSKGL